MYEQSLIQAGLNKEEAVIYETLLKGGKMTASQVFKKQGGEIKRGLVYKTLERLMEKELVEKKEKPKKVATFSPLHPLTLKKSAEKNKEQAVNTLLALDGIEQQLISDFNLSTDKPTVMSFEGKEGIKRLYDDIIRVGSDILLIRSPYDNSFPELSKLVNGQIARQVRIGIKTRAITPLDEDTIDTVSKYDKERLVTRRIVPKDKFMIPAQVVIYGNKVGITAYREVLLTTIVENQDIKNTFTTIFEYMWEKSNIKHEEILKGLKKD